MQEVKKQSEAGVKKQKPDDIIEALIFAQNSESLEKEELFCENEIFEEFMVFFMAGTETTSTFTQNMIYGLAKDPEIDRLIRQEISQHMK